MAFDGITMACMAKELNEKLSGGRISRVTQPEGDAILLTIHPDSGEGNVRLLLSANASIPLVYLTPVNLPAPQTAPNFCMVLRKYIQGGRILSVTQPGLERVLHIRVSHLDEMGDPGEKTLIFELMGKHSNLILVDEEGRILDSVKHIGAGISSVREVLPGREYFLPNTRSKRDLLREPAAKEEFPGLLPGNKPLSDALVQAFTGISPAVAREFCLRSGVDGDLPVSECTGEQLERVYITMEDALDAVKQGSFSPAIYMENGIPAEYAAIPLSHFGKNGVRSFDSVSALICAFYSEKEKHSRMKQKSMDLRHIVQTVLERDVKKYDLQRAQLKDTEKRDKYKLYGELLHIYGYELGPEAKELSCEDYHTGETVRIPLDPELTAMENAAKFYARYEKLKRTNEALSELTKQVYEEIEHLKSVLQFLNMADSEEELSQVRQELVQTGFIRDRGGKKKGGPQAKAKPLHFVSSDGFDIYVGKNNLQNEEVTFKLASGGDWWFHSKKYPGSHVILKTEGREVPDRAFEEAGAVAAYFSAGRDQEKVEIDYTLKKNVKKPGSGGAPGYVIYYTNYSMMAAPGLPCSCV